MVGGQALASEDVIVDAVGLVVAVIEGEVLCHGRVDAHHAGTVPGGVQCRDVAEAYEPLGVTGECFEVEVLKQMHRAIAAAAAQDSPHLRVVECPLQVGKALLGRRAVGDNVVGMIFLLAMLTHQWHKAPSLDGTHSTIHPLGQHSSRGRHDGKLIAWFEKRRNNHDGYILVGDKRTRGQEDKLTRQWEPSLSTDKTVLVPT